MNNLINEVSKYFNTKKMKGLYNITEEINKVVINIKGKLKSKINSDNTEFYYDFIDYIEALGNYEVDLYDENNIVIYIM